MPVDLACERKKSATIIENQHLRFLLALVYSVHLRRCLEKNIPGAAVDTAIVRKIAQGFATSLAPPELCSWRILVGM